MSTENDGSLVVPITDQQAAAAVTDLQRQLNTGNQANSVTGLYGISGTGKSNNVDEAAIYNWETYRSLTMCYAADLGGFGNKRLGLIRSGIMRVYDPRNHVAAFETMELISLGAFPETLLDAERGFADPNVKLILPRRLVFAVICPNDHVAGTVDGPEHLINQFNQACPTCQMQTTAQNAKRVDKVVVKHPMFKNVGLRAYDSLTALNEWGLSDLREQSAKGQLPVTAKGGSALGSADALKSGRFTFGTGSMPQYGFLQDRTYGWLANIKSIPDQTLPAIATFGVEQSKSDDESGGELLLGPKIAGSARTAALAGWLGNLIHATKEPYSKEDATLVYRLWLTNHVDPRDMRRVPYLAKHRGLPQGIPAYLEDAPGAEPWSGASLRVFFGLLQTQLTKIDADIKTKYPDAPGTAWSGAEGAVDEVVAVPAAATAGVVPQGVSTGIRPVAGGLRTAGGLRQVGGSAPAPAPAAVTAAPTPVVAPVSVAPLLPTAAPGENTQATTTGAASSIAAPPVTAAPPPTPPVAAVRHAAPTTTLRRAARPPT